MPRMLVSCHAAKWWEMRHAKQHSPTDRRALILLIRISGPDGTGDRVVGDRTGHGLALYFHRDDPDHLCRAGRRASCDARHSRSGGRFAAAGDRADRCTSGGPANANHAGGAAVYAVRAAENRDRSGLGPWSARHTAVVIGGCVHGAGPLCAGHPAPQCLCHLGNFAGDRAAIPRNGSPDDRRSARGSVRPRTQFVQNFGPAPRADRE